MGIFYNGKKTDKNEKPVERPLNNDVAELNESYNYHERANERIKDVAPVDDSDSEQE